MKRFNERLRKLEGDPGGIQQDVRCIFIIGPDPENPDLEPVGIRHNDNDDPFYLERLPGETIEALQDRACARAGENIRILWFAYPGEE